MKLEAFSIMVIYGIALFRKAMPIVVSCVVYILCIVSN